MVYSDDDLQRIAEMQEGSLEDISFAVLLNALSRSARSVVLEINRNQLTKEIVFESGSPVECRSNLVHETLSRFMVSAGKIDEAIANACFAESCTSGKRFGDILIERGIINAEGLFKLLQQNLAKKLLDGFSWRDGSFRMIEHVGSSDSNLKVNVAQLIIIGVTRFATQAQVDGSIGPLIGKSLTMHPEPFFSLDDIKLSAAQKPLVEVLSKRNLRVDELAGETGIPYQDLTRLLYAMTLIGNVIREDQMPAGIASQATLSEPTIKPEIRVADPPSSNDESRNDLMGLVLNHRRMDAFELLGIEENSALDFVEKRFLEFAEKYRPSRFENDLRDRAQVVFLAGARAYGKLIDPARRRTLAESRSTVNEPKSRGGSGDQFRIETNLLDPAKQFEMGIKLMAKGDFRAALTQLEFAADLDSQNAVYRAEVAFCRFKIDPEHQGRSGLVDLQQALRIDPRCGIAMYYAGEILRFQGRFAEAEDVLQKAIKPMTPDRRPIDALREIKAERKTRRK